MVQRTRHRVVARNYQLQTQVTLGDDPIKKFLT